MPGTKGEIEEAVRIALGLYDEWNEITGYPPHSMSYYYEIQSLIEDAVELGVAMGVEGKHGLKKAFQRIQDRKEGRTITAHALMCCGNCDYWMYKYCKCEHPEQREDEADAYQKESTYSCELWVWASEMQ